MSFMTNLPLVLGKELSNTGNFTAVLKKKRPGAPKLFNQVIDFSLVLVLFYIDLIYDQTRKAHFT